MRAKGKKVSYNTVTEVCEAEREVAGKGLGIMASVDRHTVKTKL